jgi:hypothetical protein
MQFVGHYSIISGIFELIKNIIMKKERVYDKPVPKYSKIMSIEEFEEDVLTGMIIDEDDGIGRWVKNKMISNDCVFETERQDADGVFWANK